MNNQEAKQVTRDYINNMKHALDLYPALASVIQDFNGKVFNKRFYTAVQERIPELRGYTDSYGRIEVYINFDYKYGYRYSNRQYHFIYMNKNQLPENKRINAERWIMDLKKGMIKLYQDIKAAEAALDQIDDIVSEFEKIENRVDQLRRAVPYVMLDWFRINYHLRTC